MTRPSRLRVAGVLAAIAGAAALLPVVVPSTSGAFLAKVNNSTNSTFTSTRFQCKDTFNATALKAAAYFEYQLTLGNATANDSGNANNTGTFQGGHTTETVTSTSACPNDTTNPSDWTLNGSSQWLSTTNTVGATPTTISLAAWFRTTVAGGYIMGLNAGQTSNGSPYDRHIYIDTAGKIEFGTYSGGYQMVVSPSAYNDGKWHQVVATMSSASGTALWVDGTMVASNASYTVAEANTGYWRIGYGPLSGWPNAPSNTYFTGAMRFVAAYSIQLTAEEIRAEYRDGKPGP